MEQTQSDSSLSAVLLSFYECLTDSDQLDTLMEMLTSWLDDEDYNVVLPNLEYHADRAWRLLGDISVPEYQSFNDQVHTKQTRLKSKADVENMLRDAVRAEDLVKVNGWLLSDVQNEALLLRVTTEQSAELVILSRDLKGDGYLAERTGPQFQRLISKFVAESFELTHAEFSLVQELLSGGTLREISQRMGKSWETTRSQVKTLTNKLGVSSQADILRMVNQAATLMPKPSVKAPLASGEKLKSLARPDGRTIVYEVDGAKSDKVLVYLHGMTQGRHWPQKAKDLAKQRGWRVVRISRAGRGKSTGNNKEGQHLLQDHVADIIAVMDVEGIANFSIFGAADGFAVGYPLALQYPERVHMIVGLEIVPPILSRKVISGFSGKMKTYGLACLYAPKTVKFMLGFAMHKLERMQDRYSGIHPLMGVELGKFEDADGLLADDLNFQDIMAQKAEGMWRDASFACVDWAFAAEDSNVRPRAALIHCGNSMIMSPGQLDDFAHRIGAPILRIDSYFPYISASLPLILDTLEPI